ncbi:MAG: hypothetical protein KBT46_03675, partial [Ruminococcus sp.]|nr:hypothetical protein [Candidatus Copronaster equi]
HKPVLADVALSGNYVDLENKPFIAENVSELINDAGYISGISSGDVVSALGFTPLANTVKFATNLNYAENRLHLKDQNGDDLGSAVSLKTFVPNILDYKWADHLLNDQNWLNADTFSWQDGTVYTSAYNHLSADISGKTLQSETIGAVTVQFYLADDGHKICPASEESNVASIYTNTGVAWYYIIDTTNTRFKLPRTKYGFNGIRDEVGKYIPESLPNIKGVIGCSRTLHEYNKQPISSGAIIATPSSQTVIGSDKYSSDVYTYSLDANNYSGVYQDNAPVQERATQMYLYFYVGEFSQSATEQTAGLNAELFNSKADADLSNINASATAKETIIGWCIPDYGAGITTGYNTAFTAPTDGLGVWAFSGNYAQIHIKLGNTTSSPIIAIQAIDINVQNACACISLPLKKGETYYIQFLNTIARVYCNTFYPFKGVNQ